MQTGIVRNNEKAMHRGWCLFENGQNTFGRRVIERFDRLDINCCSEFRRAESPRFLSANSRRYQHPIGNQRVLGKIGANCG
jgi:hypothetical protein